MQPSTPTLAEAQPIPADASFVDDRATGPAHGGLRVHPLRSALADEAHARPFPIVHAPLRASHLAVLAGEGGRDDEPSHLRELCRQFKVEPPEPGVNHFSRDFGTFRLRWERHTEFFTYTVMTFEPFDAPFDRPPITHLPPDWLAGLKGEVVSAVHVALAPASTPHLTSDALRDLFDGHRLIGSRVVEENALVWTALRVHHDGFGRIYIHDDSLNDCRAGRLIQRLLELETYRLMALLALPIAREIGPKLTTLEHRLSGVHDRIAQPGGVDQERILLHDLSGMAAEVEHIRSKKSYRFSASRAYSALMNRRLEELRETQVVGYLTLAEFLDRRMTPAMRTCETVCDRMEDLSRRLDRASDLLRTRIDLTLEAQNQELLTSMNRRADLQLRLQQTVEGLSVVAITYYALALLRCAFEGLHDAGLPIRVSIAEAVALPIILLVVYLGVRHVRKVIHKRDGSDRR